jgi:vitamin-K-epoxide reductase (warfarin-sensitive)
MKIALRVLLGLLAVAGIVISSMALRVHFMDPGDAPPCAVTEKWDCGFVNHSRYSVFPPSPKPTWDNPTPPIGHSVPVAEIGIVGYALMLLLIAFGRDRLFLLAAVGGCAFAGYLSLMEANVLEKWCIYCVWSQSVVAAMVVFGIVNVVLQTLRQRNTEA